MSYSKCARFIVFFFKPKALDTHYTVNVVIGYFCLQDIFLRVGASLFTETTAYGLAARHNFCAKSNTHIMKIRNEFRMLRMLTLVHRVRV